MAQMSGMDLKLIDFVMSLAPPVFRLVQESWPISFDRLAALLR